MLANRLRTPAPVDREPLELTDTKTPVPGPGQVRIRVRVCGVCHTDLHTAEGDLDLPRLPITPGHQVVGEVDKLGEGVTRYELGDRVGVAWLYASCGTCDFCTAGRENLCVDAKFTGLHVDGGYAQYMVANEPFTYPIPERFSDTEAAPLLCAGIIGYRSLRVSGVEPGQRLGLYGFGASAHLAIQVANHWDCKVFVFTRSQEHRELARDLGAVWVGSAKDSIDAELHASISFAPAGWIVPLALGHLRPGGVLALNAIHMSPIPEFDYQLLYGERVLRSVANFTRRDADEFLKIAAQIPIQTEVESYELAKANEALRDLKKSKINGAAALTVP